MPGYLPETWNIVEDGKDTDTNNVDLGPSIGAQKACFQWKTDSHIALDGDAYGAAHAPRLSDHADRIYNQWSDVRKHIVKVEMEPVVVIGVNSRQTNHKDARQDEDGVVAG